MVEEFGGQVQTFSMRMTARVKLRRRVSIDGSAAVMLEHLEALSAMG